MTEPQKKNKERLGAQSATEDATAFANPAPEAASHAAPTPGPWAIEIDTDGIILSDVDGRWVATASVSHDMTEWETDRANAHLIAAAPELLAACKALMLSHHGYHLGVGACICHAHEAARLAIQKAENS